MKRGLILSGLFVLLLFGCSEPETSEPCNTDAWFYSFGEESAYVVTYNRLSERPENFKGAFLPHDCSEVSSGERCLPYTLDGVPIYTGPQSHTQFEGKIVVIVGKKRAVELDGELYEEIWPLKIGCVEE